VHTHTHTNYAQFEINLTHSLSWLIGSKRMKVNTENKNEK
jgi:hypothetical protein